MKSRKYGAGELSLFAVFISAGLVLQYAESRFSVIPVPGGKIGLANIVSIINIFMFGGGNATVIACIRAFAGALLSGGAGAVPYSVAGAAASVAVMQCCKRLFYPRMSMIGMSMIGAVFHNLAQLCVAAVLFGTVYIFSYLPLMIAAGTLGGAVTGYAAQLFANRFLFRRTKQD